MKAKTVLKNAYIVNEGEIFISDLLINNGRISHISLGINTLNANVIDCSGKYLMPGMIDDQVHFREPGLAYKGDIESESRAAVAGGITSFMDMPNTVPAVLTKERLEEKYFLAAQKSVANYSFFMGVGRSNWEEALKTDTETICGLSDDGLYLNDHEATLSNDPDFLELLFSRSHTLIALHCEDQAIIDKNIDRWYTKYPQNPCMLHARIRSEQACLSATDKVIGTAKKHNNRVHLLHISTLAEALLLDTEPTVRQKRITAEACLPHLWFSDKDYERLGNQMKWNPSVKTLLNKEGLLKSLLAGHLDIIATDHAPHLISEKEGDYFSSKSGGPLVQHALVMLLELYQQDLISLTQIVEKTSHNVAEAYRIKERGYIREGYYADLVLVDLNLPTTVNAKNTLYKCGWSPVSGQTFHSTVTHTWVNGNLVFDNGHINARIKGMRLGFEKIR